MASPRKKAVPKKNSKAIKKKTAPKKAVKKAAPKKKAATKAAAKKATPKKGLAAKSKPNTRQAGPPSTSAPPAFEVDGQNNAALFTLKVYRGEGMALLAMNWRTGKPTSDFVGFAIEYQEPKGTQFYALSNRLSFLDNSGNVNPNILSTRLSPIQKFRWIHFPFHANLPGLYVYRVTPVFMNAKGELSYGDYQQAAIQLQSETYPGQLNVTFTRGFISSQAFVDRFGTNGGVGTLIPGPKDNGLTFTSTDPQQPAALDWMGFEDRLSILDALDQAIQDTSAQVRVTAYDFDEPEVVSRLVKLGSRLQIIIDDTPDHGPGTPATQAAGMLIKSAGAGNVQRQHMGELQHNKTIAVNGKHVQLAVCGSTNFSWRGFFVQNNNTIVLHGAAAVKIFFDAFDNLWKTPNAPAGFVTTPSASWNDLQIPGIQAQISFSPHSSKNALLPGIADAIGNTTSNLFYSLAFLYQTPGKILDAIEKVAGNKNLFVYGLSNNNVKGLDLQLPDGNAPIAYPAALLQDVPEPFKAEATGGNGIRLHHKFVVIDFDKPTARVYMGSHNLSSAADTKNAENLLLIQDRRVAVSYMIEAVSMFDHYEWRDALAKAQKNSTRLYLKTPPKNQQDVPWWDEDYTVPQKARDRILFAGG